MNLETKLQERATSRLGEMAGFSLTACDVDGDGRDEVVVAAPFGRVPGTFGAYEEVGRVTVLGSEVRRGGARAEGGGTH